MVKQRVSEEVSSSSIVAPYGFHSGGEPDVVMHLGTIANLPDVRTDFAIEALCKCSLEDETFKWLSNAINSPKSDKVSQKLIQAVAMESAISARNALYSDEDRASFAEAMTRLVTAYFNLREGIFRSLTGKEELSWSKIKDYTTDVSAVVGFLAGRYQLWKNWKLQDKKTAWVDKLVYMVVGNEQILTEARSDGALPLPSRVELKIGTQEVASWKRTYGALKPFVTTAMRSRLMLLGIILKILNIDQSSLLYFDLFRSASRWKEMSTESSDIGSYGKLITERMLRSFSEAKEGCLPVLSQGKPRLADYMALVMILGQVMVDIDYTVHLEGLKEGIPLTWENYAVQIRYSLILNEDVFEIAYQREVETTWSMLGPRWEQGDRPAPIAFPWLAGQINAATIVSDKAATVLGTHVEAFELDKVSVIPETYDLTENTHYPWVGCELSKAGWLIPSEPDSYDKPTITYLSLSDVPVSVGVSRKPFSNSVFDVSIDVAIGDKMIQSISSLFDSVPDNSMGVGRIFRDKGIVFKWIGNLPTFGSVSSMMQILPEFTKLLKSVGDV
jgi:hypothetical protein